ncbi:MAG: YbgC/FadM family acyl-CoA thioesterase [Burkholderiales bacterium]|jgi:acyl-CoA thioester hydrolase|nr:YbgC/FadM family acyl-CoA thioesterase [Burkholderiales bacterium]
MMNHHRHPSNVAAPALPFVFPVRVYYEDTDAAGVTYYANYLKFIERARTEWLSAFHIELPALERDEHTVFVVKRVEIEYLGSARLGDRLLVFTEPVKIRAAALELAQKITLNEKVIIDSVVTLVTLNTQTWLPKRIPDVVRELIATHYPHLLS